MILRLILEIVYHHIHGLQQEVTVRQCSVSSKILMTRTPNAQVKRGRSLSYARSSQNYQREGHQQETAEGGGFFLALNFDGGIKFVYLCPEIIPKLGPFCLHRWGQEAIVDRK